MHFKLGFMFPHFYPVVNKLCLSRQSLPSAAMIFAGVVKVQKHFLIVYFQMQTNYPAMKTISRCWNFLDISPWLRFAWSIWLCQEMVYPTWFPQCFGFLPDGVAEIKHLKALAQLPGPSHEWWVLYFCFSIMPPYSHIYTNTLPKHRHTIHWDLWAQYMYFNGWEEAPDLTTGRPLWAVDCRENWCQKPSEVY